ncbi:hypothetical protein CH063_05518 [Colletotrichum higginsianum]|uniref:Uncharacterized protein n=1 Tax=Colletotrichum higginsianum (strain IMI 349063) TaxID=759273 RepID=H1UZA3_COLHI|nr:hypothetical protein CH63R_07425 [Colletotrichum higginsianum IMI 349063]OBR08660.1 hypothetical protein CH63R_07425 [Colletotrichum higginsianum IMI 349063]CCF33304.1 hypothetical protein CH063_05518 [Colletotrichum higginsianum]
MVKETGSANGTKHVGTYNVTPVHAEQSAAQSVLGSPGIEAPPSAKACVALVFITTDWVFLIFALCVLGPTHGANKLQFGNVSAARGQYRPRFCKRAALERYGKHVEYRGHGSHLDI